MRDERQAIDENRSDGPITCLCCENPPAVDVPGRAAIEETIRQAKDRELGDKASDPFEMEAE